MTVRVFDQNASIARTARLPAKEFGRQYRLIDRIRRIVICTDLSFCQHDGLTGAESPVI
jgi:hypothetical protein